MGNIILLNKKFSQNYSVYRIVSQKSFLHVIHRYIISLFFNRKFISVYGNCFEKGHVKKAVH